MKPKITPGPVKTPPHWFPLVAALLAPLSGCDWGAPGGEVAGQVTVAGAPVQFGAIGFISAEGRAATATIQNGAYRATNVPTGPAKVTVQSVRIGTPVGHPTLGPAPTSASPGTFVAVPNRYSLPQTSGLEYEVVAGPQVKDFALEGK